MRRRFLQKSDDKYLTIEVLEDGNITFTYYLDLIVYCRINKGSWRVLYYPEDEIAVERGQVVEFKGLMKDGYNRIGSFYITSKCNLRGNALSLIFGDSAQGQTDISNYSYVFSHLFENNNNIIEVSNDFLPATTLAHHCYEHMFYNCTNLITAPELPATTLSNNCYQYMFYGCSNLTTAPELPATTLVSYCYSHMFYDCSKLNYIKMLAYDTSTYGYLGNWVAGVSSTGTFVKNPNMTSLPTGINGIPSGWTVVNDGED